MKMLIKKFIDENKACIYKTLKELCDIPAPSHFEHKRAEYCKKWLENIGAKNVYIDEALNVIYPLNTEKSDELTVFVAHTDTVFPDTEPMPYFDDGERIHSPGVADDTASVVVLLMMAKFFTENNIIPEKGILFICNSCEEGLGNLKGTRQICKDYSGRIKQFISFDSNIGVIDDVCVGSHRYEVEVITEGGHSFGAFGNKNAIAELSKIINEIYKIKVPEKEGTRTTYNVGIISGGTSVNTIAQNAKMLCEYRSDDKDSMSIMEEKFNKIFKSANTKDVKVNVKKVGDRPCGNTDAEKIEALKKTVASTIEEVTGEKVRYSSSSTDCNIPASLGIPSLCTGVNIHQYVHTREEWVDKKSIITGLEIAINLGLNSGEIKVK